MGLLSNYIGSFCEVKIAGLYKVVCTGHIVSVDDKSITFNKVILRDTAQNFDAVVTVLGQSQGLQVFKASGVTVTGDIISFATMSKIIDTERRAAYRVIVDLPALVTENADLHTGYDAIIKDMSVRGISLWVHKKFDIDDIINIQFPLNFNDQKVCTCTCNIVRTIGGTGYSMKKYGCEFVAMSKETESAVKRFINKERTKLMQQEFFK